MTPQKILPNDSFNDNLSRASDSDFEDENQTSQILNENFLTEIKKN